MSFFYRCTFYSAISLLGIALCTLLLLGVEGAVMSLLQLVGLADKGQQILSLVASLPLSIVAGGLLAGILVLALGLYKEKVVLKSIRFFVKSFVDAFKNLFISLTAWEIVCVMAVPLLASIYFAANIAVSYDEAITYNYFTRKPFFYCMIFYPYPNNHVLHTLFTHITDVIPFGTVLFKMRIPAILSSLFTWLIGYSFLKKYYSSRVAILVVGLASVCYLSIYYSFMSRGYAFTVLAFVVCLYAAFNIIWKGNRIKDWLFFVVAGVLGCYAIPSFLYAFATVNVLILVYNYKNIKYQFWANVIAGTLVILCYAPIMLVDGIASLTSNQFVQHVSRGDILEGFSAFYIAMFGDIAGVPFWSVGFMLIPLLLTVLQRDKKHLSLWAIFLIAPFVLIFIHAVNPFYRTFLYYSFATLMLMVVPFQKYLESVPKSAIIVSILIIQIIAIYIFDSKVRINEGFNTDAAAVSEEFFEKGQTVIFPCIASANYEFEAITRGLSDEIHFLNNEKANVDTINNCDYVILEIWRDETVHKKPYLSTSEQNIYKNNK